MASWLSGVQPQAKDLWNNMSSTAKVLAVGTVLTLVVIGVGYSAISSKTSYSTLGTFQPQEAGQVVSKLTAAKIKYELGGDGFTILVPQDSLRQAKLTLGVNGLPTGGVVGQEIFNTTNLMTTQFERDVNFKRAIEGELTRAIDSMDKVANARVLLAMPKESLFIRDQQEAKATVVLQLKPQQRMSADDVRSILLTVSGALTGLKPENVVVVDTQSHVLSQGVAIGGSDSALSTAQLDTQQKQSQLWQDQLQRQLEAAVGVGNVTVAVTANLDFAKSSQETKTYTQGPTATGPGVKVSEQTTKETATTTGGSATSGGTAGVPSAGQAGSSGGGGEVEKSNSTINYTPSSQTTVTQTAPGTTPKSIAVMVLVNSEKVTPEEMARLDLASQTFAKGIAGVVVPTVTVSAVKFNQDIAGLLSAQNTETPVTPTQSWTKYLGYAGVAVGLLVVFLLLRSRKPAGGMGQPALAGAGGPMTAGAALEMLAAAAQQPKNSEDKSPAQRRLDFQEKAELLGEDFLAQMGVDPTKQKLRDEVEQLARENPDKVASLLKTWIAEE